MIWNRKNPHRSSWNSAWDMFNSARNEENHYSISALIPNAEKIIDIYDKNVDAINESIRTLVRNLSLEPEVFPFMTYSEAIGFFITNRPLSSRVEKGAMLRQQHSRGELLIQVFLDQDDQIICQFNGAPYGRQVVVQRFDEELRETFGRENMVIIK